MPLACHFSAISSPALPQAELHDYWTLTYWYKPFKAENMPVDDIGCGIVTFQPLNSISVFWVTAAFNLMAPFLLQIMIGEAILYCCLSKRRNGIGTEANINAGGCNFNSFLRRAVRFVGGFQMLVTKKSVPYTFSYHHAGFLLWSSLSEQRRAVTGIDLPLPQHARRNCHTQQQSSSFHPQECSIYALCFPFPLLSVFLKE